MTDYLLAQVEAGADAVQLFDSWAGVLPEDGARALVRRSGAGDRADAAPSAHPDVPLIAFPRGIGAGLERYAEPCRRRRSGLDTAVPMGWAARRLRPEGTLCLQGNLDPLALLGPVGPMLDGGGPDRRGVQPGGRSSSTSATACCRRRRPSRLGRSSST